jgi:hypothetical protein
MGGTVKMFLVVDAKTQVRLHNPVYSKARAEALAQKHTQKGRAAVVEEVQT